MRCPQAQAGNPQGRFSHLCTWRAAWSLVAEGTGASPHPPLLHQARASGRSLLLPRGRHCSGHGDTAWDPRACSLALPFWEEGTKEHTSSVGSGRRGQGHRPLRAQAGRWSSPGCSAGSHGLCLGTSAAQPGRASSGLDPRSPSPSVSVCPEQGQGNRGQ